MAIVKNTIKSAIISLLEQPFDHETSPEDLRDQFADALATVIEDAIKSATITIPSGTIVTSGSATTQTQSAQATINGGLS